MESMGEEGLARGCQKEEMRKEQNTGHFIPLFAAFIVSMGVRPPQRLGE